MNKNLEEILGKIVHTLDIINEYGDYVDAYVKQEVNPSLLLTTMGGLTKGIEKAIFFKENEKMIMMILDNAIKKFTQGDILLEIQEPLKELGVDISAYIDKLDAETVKVAIKEIVKNIDKEKIQSLLEQIRYAR